MPPKVLSRDRAPVQQQRLMNRPLQPLVLVVATLVEVGGATGHPRPGWHGVHLAVLLAMTGFALGVVGLVGRRERVRAEPVAYLLLIIATSAVLVRAQPGGPAVLGAFVAVAVAAMRVRGRLGAAIAVVAMITMPLVQAFAHRHTTVEIVLQDVGVLAFYTMALMADRLREGQQHAEQLLAEIARNRDAQARSAVLAERQRLAREMHDVLAHSLSGLALQIEGARLLADSRGVDAEVVEALERAHHLARTGLDEARRSIGLLRDEELPGPERLPQLVDQFRQDAAIPTSISVTGRPRGLAPDARLTVYRAAQEALTNVRKHARCARVELRLDYEPRGTRLTVEDFGATGHGTPVDNGGYGLTGMRERAELLGGSLTARPTDTGFKVELWVPN